MSILSTEQLGHSFNDRWLFKDLHFALQKGDRIALVGINGTGKSSLLKILSGELQPSTGRVVSERGVSIGFLNQNPDFEGFKTINDYIFSSDNIAQNLIKEYEELVQQPNPDQKRLEKLTEEISAIDAWEYEHKITSILSRLGISDFKQAINTLSGGQRKRLTLAKLLIDDPEVIILDEPTNHLDIETIEWLEKLLTTGQKTILLVSHDRYFLDNICTEIRELDRGKIYNYKGNYGYFLEKKAEREAADHADVLRARNLLKRELEWMRRQPQARGTKSKSRIDAFYGLEKRAKEQVSNGKVELSVKVSRQGKKILELESVAKSFDGKTIINNFSYVFKRGDRIGFAGRNGTGKSTLLNLFTGDLLPDAGSIERGETLTFGYYKQEGLTVSEDDRVLDVVKQVADYISMANGETITASQLLTHFLFPPEKQFGLVRKLSGGERKRLQLMRVLMRNPNFLILDEPANDLDIDTLNVLEEFLENYPGVLVMVSHDRYLLDKLTDQLFIFEGEGKVRIYNGNYADFKEEQEEAIRLEKEKNQSKQTTEKQKKDTPVKKKRSFKEQKEFESLEVEITALETEITEKTTEMNEITDHIKLSEIGDKLIQLNEKLDEKTERWMILSEIES